MAARPGAVSAATSRRGFPEGRPIRRDISSLALGLRLFYPFRVRSPPLEIRAAARRALALADAALVAECREEFFVAGGPGGQHRNKTESGVRLAHGATGVTVSATERRSQAQNRAAAVVRLRARLALLARAPRVRRPTKPSRRASERRLAAKKKHGERKAMRARHFD
jgi:ribosome-associated protein